jgi:dienelactone hydrolase
VFKPKDYPKLGNAKGKAFFIDHCPDDKPCPLRMAEEARDTLKKAGANVEFVTYAGGHGWQGPLWDRLVKGREHLEKFAGKREAAGEACRTTKPSPLRRVTAVARCCAVYVVCGFALRLSVRAS